jgi:phage terminase large subunit-like protein
MEPGIEELTPDKLKAIQSRLEVERDRRLRENRLAGYKAYPKQAAFHAAGATLRERLFLAANQSGKTFSGGMETAMHVTGRYPEWWVGKRFDRPTIGWCAGVTSESCRDTIERILLGRSSARGTGCIPKDAILEIISARGVPEACELVRVRHVSGGVSTIGFKAYSDGRPKFQGETLDWAWLDEEPPPDIYSECMTRTNIGNGPVWITATPLLGMSEVIQRFLLDKSPDRFVITMTIDECEHFSEEEKQRIIASYGPHEVEARTKGIPVLGSGRVFPIAEDKILVEPFECPKHFVKLGACDFGWTHYAAFVEIWWDRDLDIVYLARTLRMREKTPHQHVDAVRHWNLKQWAWPHDGRNSTLAGAGVPLKQQYADAGLDMMFEHATFPDGSNSVEAGVLMMADRMRGDRWKVFKGQNEAWLQEFRTYHRDINGVLVKSNDDAISASRYGMMMLRHGRTAGEMAGFNRPIKYKGSRSYV